MKRVPPILLTVLLLCLLGLTVFTAPAHAIDDPNAPPQVSAVYVFEFDDGSLGVLIDYYLDYDPVPGIPAETVTEAYLAVFYDTVSATQFKSVAPYTFVDSGYGRGMVWLPFTADEVVTLGIDSAHIADYEIWLTGNPTVPSGWTGDPPKTVASIDQWNDTGDMAVLLALRVLYYADVLEMAWSLDMVESTAEGNRLTSTGESYFTNVISGLRSLAPACFSDIVLPPDYVAISYNTVFGATATSGTATLAGSPVTLSPSIELANSSFETSDPPMGWTLVGAGATFTRSTVQVQDEVYSGLLTRTGTDTYIYQTVDPTSYLGEDVVFGAWVYATAANRARVAVDDDTAAVGYSGYHTGVAGWEWLTVTYTVGAAATELQVRCYVDTGDTSAYFDNVALVEDDNVLDTGATVGTIILDLAYWTFGAIMDGTGTIANTPIDLRPGVNTLTVTGAGTFMVVVDVEDTATMQEAAIKGTAFDLTGLGSVFGMSRWQISGLVWMAITVLICLAAYRQSRRGGVVISGGGTTKVVLLLFTVSVVAGVLLGLLHPLVASLLFIMCGAFIGYILFFRNSESLHKGFMFMMWMFLIVSFAGNFAAGSGTPITATYLTTDVTDTEVSIISVAGTDGFPDSGIIVIDDEHIGYPSKTDTTFVRATAGPLVTNPLVRAMDGTEAVEHSTGATVRTREASFLNASIDYKIARITDPAGGLDYLTMPARLLSLVGTFFILPLDFLGTDLAILSYIWMVVAVGMVVGLVISIIGGRRV